MKRFAVIGDPISHTLSPLIHNYNFKLNDNNYEYHAIHVLRDDIADIRTIAKDYSLYGFNVTLPHKQRIMRYLDNVSKEAQHVGAVNTVQIENGRFAGHNTDVSGYRQALLEKFDLTSGLNVLILGGGGAAKAVHYVHHHLEHEVTVAVRDVAKLDNFSDLPFYRVHFNDVNLNEYDIIINATPIGLNREDVMKVLGLGADINENTIGIDLIYHTPTPFLDYFRNHMDGLGMLVHQAMDAYTIWTGHSGHPEEIKAMLRDRL